MDSVPLNKPSVSTGEFVVVQTIGIPPKKKKKNIERAVYAHIRAMRALGRTRTNTAEIASALGINPGRVLEAVRNLQAKGVRLAE